MCDQAASYWFGEKCGASFTEGVSIVGSSVGVVVRKRGEDPMLEKAMLEKDGRPIVGGDQHRCKREKPQLWKTSGASRVRRSHVDNLVVTKGKVEATSLPSIGVSVRKHKEGRGRSRIIR